MKRRYEYLEDKQFLLKVDNMQIKKQYAKIILLDWNENPIQEIQGLVTNGNLNLDGKSAVRRTCSLTVFVSSKDYVDVTNIDNLFSLNKKMTLEIGFENTTGEYTQYDMLWFPQGLFIMNGISLSHSTSGATINLTCKDKMCLLNGDVRRCHSRINHIQ